MAKKPTIKKKPSRLKLPLKKNAQGKPIGPGKTNAATTKLEERLNETQSAEARAESEFKLAERLKAEAEHNETFDDKTFNLVPESRPDALYSIESVIYSQIAILMRRKNMPDGLKPQEWTRLNDLVRMMKGLTDMEMTTTKKSLLEGLSNDEVLALVDEAKKTLLED